MTKKKSFLALLLTFFMIIPAMFMVTACSSGSKGDPAHTHSYSEDWKTNSTQHWHECDCGEKSDIANHVYDNDSDLDCNICGYTRTIDEAGHTHSYSEDWKTNSTQHWHECGCGEKSDKASHVYDSDCDVGCNVCGLRRVVAGHNFVDGVCSKCSRVAKAGVLNYKYDKSTQSYTVTGVTSKYDVDYVIIPETYDDGVNGSHPVTSIEASSFSDSFITSVTIPNSVTSIGDSAFHTCVYLSSINIPNNVDSIGEHAFQGCTCLTNIVIPDSVTSIGKQAFYECASLKNVTMGSGVTSIGKLAFQSCSSLTSIVIPDKVSTIEDQTFKNCTRLSSVTIGSGVTSIGDWAFEECSSLISINIPDNVKSIGFQAFYACVDLTSVTIGSGVTSIDSNAFMACASLTSISIPDSVTNIGSSAFSGCTRLVSVKMGKGVTSLGYRVFFRCSSITNVYYGGTAEEWGAMKIDDSNSYFTNATRYYYSATEPEGEGNYWHYAGDGKTPVAW